MSIPKNKTIINIDDYTGFRWNGKHTSELGLTIVSSSSRYNLNPISSITNNTVDIPGGDGQYLFNSTYGPKKWTINFVFDNLDDYQWRDLLRWLYHKDTSDLVFDELPYKAYNAKLEGTPSVKYLTFDEVMVKEGDDSLDKDTLKEVDWTSPELPSFILEDKNGNNFDKMYYKKRIYKGEGSINLVAFFPYAYSARTKDGKYMKYLDEVEYFPNDAKAYTEEHNIDHTTTIVKDGKFTLELNSIKGNNVIDTESHKINRSVITEDSSGAFSLSINNKKWIDFNLSNMDSNNNKEFVCLDKVGDVYDTIEFIDNKYQLIKRVNNINLLENEYFIEQFLSYYDESNDIFIPNEQGKFSLKLNFQSLLTDEQWNNIDINTDNINKILLSNNYFTFIAPPQDKQEISYENYMYIEDRSIRNHRTKKLKFNLIIVDNTIDALYFRQLLEIIKNGSYRTELEYISNYSNETCLLFYPQQKQEYNIVSSKNINNKLHSYFTDNILLSIKNNYGSKDNLSYAVNFTFTPALYDNFNEWADSSGLKDSQYDPNTKIYYDDCNQISGTEATFGYKIYNGGDLQTPFRIKLPVINKAVKSDLSEITFVLAQKNEDNLHFDLNKYQTVSSVLELEKNIAYGFYNTDETIKYNYYFYKIQDYANNIAQFIDISNGNFLTVELNNKRWHYEDKEEHEQFISLVKLNKVENNLNILNSFSIRFCNNDALNSYADIIQQYTAAAEKQENVQIENILEIDTYKQTINFIITSQNTGQKTIIPCYFMLSKGNLFYIPPEIDNLYLLVYNQREKGNSFISNNYKQIPSIEYRYLYL